MIAGKAKLAVLFLMAIASLVINKIQTFSVYNSLAHYPVKTTTTYAGLAAP